MNYKLHLHTLYHTPYLSEEKKNDSALEEKIWLFSSMFKVKKKPI